MLSRRRWQSLAISLFGKQQRSYIASSDRPRSPPLPITTLTSREFNQDTSRAKKAAKRGPVFITDRGRPAHVLLTIEAYRRLSGGKMSLSEALAQKEPGDFDFDPPRMGAVVTAIDTI